MLQNLVVNFFLPSEVWLEIISFLPITDTTHGNKIKRRGNTSPIHWRARVKEIVNLQTICSSIRLNNFVFYNLAKEIITQGASSFRIHFYCDFHLLNTLREKIITTGSGGDSVVVLDNEQEEVEKNKIKRREKKELKKFFEKYNSNVEWKEVLKTILKESFVERHLERLTETWMQKMRRCGFVLRELSCAFVVKEKPQQRKHSNQSDDENKVSRDGDDLVVMTKFRENLMEFNEDFLLSVLNPIIQRRFNYKLLNIKSASNEGITEFDHVEITTDERFRRRLMDWWFGIARSCFKELKQSMKRRVFGGDCTTIMKLKGTIENHNVEQTYPTFHFNVKCIVMVNNDYLVTLIFPDTNR